MNHTGEVSGHSGLAGHSWQDLIFIINTRVSVIGLVPLQSALPRLPGLSFHWDHSLSRDGVLVTFSLLDITSHTWNLKVLAHSVWSTVSWFKAETAQWKGTAEGDGDNAPSQSHPQWPLFWPGPPPSITFNSDLIHRWIHDENSTAEIQFRSTSSASEHPSLHGGHSRHQMWLSSKPHGLGNCLCVCWVYVLPFCAMLVGAFLLFWLLC